MPFSFTSTGSTPEGAVDTTYVQQVSIRPSHALPPVLCVPVRLSALLGLSRRTSTARGVQGWQEWELEPIL